jgi:hypothetical protein
MIEQAAMELSFFFRILWFMLIKYRFNVERKMTIFILSLMEHRCIVKKTSISNNQLLKTKQDTLELFIFVKGTPPPQKKFPT